MIVKELKYLVAKLIKLYVLNLVVIFSYPIFKSFFFLCLNFFFLLRICKWQERNSLEHDKDRLKTSLNKSLTHSQQLSAELELSQNKVMDLKSQISRLETALEKVSQLHLVLDQQKTSVHFMSDYVLYVASKR